MGCFKQTLNKYKCVVSYNGERQNVMGPQNRSEWVGVKQRVLGRNEVKLRTER